MTKTPQRRGRSQLRGGQNKNKGIGVENIRWSAVILTGVVLLALFVCDGLYSAVHPNQGKGISASSAVMQDAQGTGDTQEADSSTWDVLWNIINP